MKKRIKAQASVVAVVLLILIAVTTVVIVGNIVYGVAKRSSASSSADADVFNIKLKIEDSKMYVDGNAKIRVTRESGGGSISGVKFNFYNSTDFVTSVIKNQVMNEFESRDFVINANEINTNSKIDKISIVPFSGSSIGNEIQEIEGKIKRDGQGNRVYDASKDNGIVSWWKFDEESGTTAYDSAGNNNGNIDTSSPNGVEFKEDNLIGNVFNFKGAGKGVTIPHDSSLNFGKNNFSLAFWIYPESFSGIYAPDYGIRIMEKQRWPTGAWWDPELFITGELVFDMNEGSDAGGNSGYTESDNLISLNTWTFITIVVDRTNFKTSYYFDGIKIAERFFSTNFDQPLQNDNAIAIGNSWNPFKGSLSNLMIFNKSLSDAEVNAIYINTYR